VIFSLKVDVDTFRGMREGLPRMLEIFLARKIRATIFVSMGPDHSGRAIRRIITKPGFLSKMLRTKAVSLYGPKTVLYGTLLPGPRIASRNAEIFRRIEAEGHEAGVHGWDHVRWQDGLPKFGEATIARELARAFEVFGAITGHRPRSTAAPGWIANERSFAVQDGLELLYSSDVRGECPFRPRAGGRVFRTLQIPTTLPTLDEMIGREDIASSPAARATGQGGTGSDEERALNAWLVEEAKRQAAARPQAPVVHTVHTEVEGLSRADLFADLLDRLLAEGARFERLDEIAGRCVPGAAAGPSQKIDSLVGTPSPEGSMSSGVSIPVCDVRDGTLPGRSGTLACQVI
jgi:undecaprenyl phosphate-alpha-L-ara4FN deformylase